MLDWNRTRKALTTHYFVTGPGQKHWNPLASAAAGRWTKSKVVARNEEAPSSHACVRDLLCSCSSPPNLCVRTHEAGRIHSHAESAGADGEGH